MRLIFSRKGFDSAAGGCPSPIVAGRPVSLPIPTRMPSAVRYGDLEGEYATMVEDLTRGRLNGSAYCHLDPDLDAGVLTRSEGWRGSLGQTGAAQAHLANNGVASGDIFLFWGLFQPVECAGRWTYRGVKEHRIFGWLQVGDRIHLGPDGGDALQDRPWLDRHPHARNGWGENNNLYVAADKLRFEGRIQRRRGWGTFAAGHRLTVVGEKRPSMWTVPDWLNPARGGVGMTYHPPDRWTSTGVVRTAARGQEFVADIGDRDDAIEWLINLFGECE
jgi:hypothetical protein